MLRSYMCRSYDLWALDGPHLAMGHFTVARDAADHDGYLIDVYDTRSSAGPHGYAPDQMPRYMAMDDGRLAMVAGRFGCHFRYSPDCMLHVGGNGRTHAVGELRQYVSGALLWRGAHVAYGVHLDGHDSVERFDAIGGGVSRSVSVETAGGMFGLADGAGVARFVDGDSMWIDDGRAPRVQVLSLTHNAVKRSVVRPRAHPDGRTLVTETLPTSQYALQFWDMRALARPYAVGAIDYKWSQNVKSLAFVRDELCFLRGKNVLRLDVRTGKTAGEWTLPCGSQSCLTAEANDAYLAVQHSEGPASRIELYSFDTLLS